MKFLLTNDKASRKFAVAVIDDLFELFYNNGVCIDGGIRNKDCLVEALGKFLQNICLTNNRLGRMPVLHQSNVACKSSLNKKMPVLHQSNVACKSSLNKKMPVLHQSNVACKSSLNKKNACFTSIERRL